MSEPRLITTNPVNSSNIKAVGYEKQGRILQVDFWNGSKYQYTPVTQEAFDDLMKAESAGKYFNENIRTNTLLTVLQITQKPSKLS